jgi:hypothetical protein
MSLDWVADLKAGDRIRTGDVQLGKLLDCSAELLALQ